MAGVKERRFGGFAWNRIALNMEQLRGSVDMIRKFRVA